MHLFSIQSSINFVGVLLLLYVKLVLCYQQVCNHQDQFSLLTFFATIQTSSSPPLNWSTSVSYCQWEGVHCNSKGRVKHLKLPSRGLEGNFTLPLRSFANLTYLNLSDNSLSGPIPWFLCSSSSLETLDLSYNHFSGPISSEIGGCSKLKVLQVSSNSLSGTIPNSIFGLRRLTEISLSGNNFHGSIKEGIVRLTNLRIIDLSSNSISGHIPYKIGKLSYLQKLYLSDNNLSGPIPSSLMRCKNIRDIILRNNVLEGEISKLDWSRLGQLQKLDLANNTFNGSLPESIYSCKLLVAYRVTLNNFTGQMSPKIIQLKSLSFLSLAFNSLTNVSRMLTSLANCQKLTFVSIGGNFFGEALPSDESFLGPAKFSNLYYFSLVGCNLTGSFPRWLSHLRSLRLILLGRNKITDQIPPWLGTLPNLLQLNLDENNLFGEIPQQLCKMPALILENIDPKLSHIHLELPIYGYGRTNNLWDEFTTVSTTLDLKSNNLSGHIPSEISQLQNLRELFLGNNHFSSSIPVELSHMKNLENLDLSRNNLTGKIPTSLEKLHFLSDFDVSFNDLKGPIPTGGQFATFDASSFEGNPRLCGELLQRPCSNRVEPKAKDDSHLKTESGNKQAYLNGAFVGFASGFSSVVAIMASYIWYKVCTASVRSGLFN